MSNDSIGGDMFTHSGYSYNDFFSAENRTMFSLDIIKCNTQSCSVYLLLESIWLKKWF